MSFLHDINLINLLFIVIIAVPIISGMFMQFSSRGVKMGLWSLFDNISFILGVFLSIYLTRRIFFEHRGDVYEQIYNQIPLHIRTVLYGQDVLVYLMAGTLILFLLLAIIRPLLKAFYRAVLDPLADALYALLSKGGPLFKGLAGALVQLPRAAFSVLLVGLALNFLVYCFPFPALSQNMNESVLYQMVYREALCPVLNSNLAKEIPVIVNDAFARTVEKEFPDRSTSADGWEQIEQALTKGRIIEYFNGVTLDEAVRSNSQIEQTAVHLVAGAKSGKEKAYIIYKWVSKNISYDYDKASKLSSDPSGIDSGSIVAFNSRTGVCFDYSCLYVSMCRAAGLKVRLVTGLAYSGTAWGDHAWNQVYSPEENRWINVDTTFGRYADYFDKPDFIADHRDAQVQGEW